jgi:hypothetical protein
MQIQPNSSGKGNNRNWICWSATQFARLKRHYLVEQRVGDCLAHPRMEKNSDRRATMHSQFIWTR